MNTPYLLVEIAVLVCACYVFITAFKFVWHEFVERGLIRLKHLIGEAIGHLRARHEQKRREVWWETGFQAAMGVMNNPMWTTREDLVRDLLEFYESRRG
jgi:hypothetical protein